jgi:hypothetical protein
MSVTFTYSFISLFLISSDQSESRFTIYWKNIQKSLKIIGVRHWSVLCLMFGPDVDSKHIEETSS